MIQISTLQSKMVVNTLQRFLTNYINFIPTPVSRYMVEMETLVMIRGADALWVALTTGGRGDSEARGLISRGLCPEVIFHDYEEVKGAGVSYWSLRHHLSVERGAQLRDKIYHYLLRA